MTASTDEIPPTDGSPGEASRDRGIWYASSALALFALFLYGDLLFSRSGVVMSHEFGDTCGAFVWWRQFGFGELAKGNLPLWNPYVFCGAPFVGNLQSAMFYPVNALLYLSLPLPNAINAEIVFHSLLVGYSMMAWARTRSLAWLPCVLAGTVAMAGTPIFFRIDLGQLNVLAVYAWLPLTLLVVDRLLHGPSAGWVLLGVFAVSMQVLAGYPPAVFNNAVAIALYCGFRLLRHRNRLRTAAILTPIAIIPLLIGAAPIAAGYHTMRESLRADGTSYEFATTWSLPIENFLTALVPHFFGDYRHVTYWGRWCLWDVSLYIGIGCLFLLAFGVAYAPRRATHYSRTMLVLLLLTAMGRYTPFYALLYDYVPGFSSFRAPSKFLLPALIFASMLAGLGAGEFLRQPRMTRVFSLAAAAISAVMLAVALALQFIPALVSGPYGLWRLLILGMSQSDESYPWEPITEMGMYNAAVLASVSAFVASGTCIAIAYLFYRSRTSNAFRTMLVCFSIAELLVFCRYARVATDLHSLASPDLAALRTKEPGDYRVFHVKSFNANWRRNYPMRIRQLNPWGYDPVVSDRYVRVFTYALGRKQHQRFLMEEAAITSILDPISMSIAHGIYRFTFEDPEGKVSNDDPPFVRMNKLFQLTRCRYVYFWPENENSLLGGITGIYEVRNPLPRFSIYRDVRILPNPGAILEAMGAESTDLASTLFLESPPVPGPIPNLNVPAVDSIELIDESTDHVSLEVKLGSPGVLLITDAYSDGWTVQPLSDRGQRKYQIVPADVAFQGIPLDAGSHRFTISYAPAVFAWGLRISGASSIGLVLACILWTWRKRRAAPARATPPAPI